MIEYTLKIRFNGKYHTFVTNFDFDSFSYNEKVDFVQAIDSVCRTFHDLIGDCGDCEVHEYEI